MINVGIVGAGFFGEMHARALAAIDGARLVAAVRRDPAALAAFTAQYGGQGYTDYQQMMAHPGLDVVVVATPHHLHTPVVRAAAQAGKHIFLEKPMASTLEECDEINALARSAGVQLMVGHINQFARAYQTAHDILASGELGEIVLGISTMSKFWFEPNRRPWHLDRATGGGMWLSAGMHCLDRLTWLIGSPVSRVAAQFATRFHNQQADDVGMIFLRYANGAAGTVVSTGYRNGAPKHMTELTCTRGMLNIEYSGVTIGRDERWTPVPDSGTADWMPEALVNEWRSFLAALSEGCEPPVTGSYARHIMAVVFAAEESSRIKAEVTVPDPWTESRVASFAGQTG